MGHIGIDLVQALDVRICQRRFNKIINTADSQSARDEAGQMLMVQQQQADQAIQHAQRHQEHQVHQETLELQAIQGQLETQALLLLV